MSSRKKNKRKNKIYRDSKRMILIDTTEGDYTCQFDDDDILPSDMMKEHKEGENFTKGCLFMIGIIFLIVCFLVGLFS